MAKTTRKECKRILKQFDGCAFNFFFLNQFGKNINIIHTNFHIGIQNN